MRARSPHAVARQPRWQSALEATANVAVGYAVALATQIAVFPVFGLHPSLGDNIAISAIFTGVSLMRSYVIRRFFEAWRTP